MTVIFIHWSTLEKWPCAVWSESYLAGY